MGGEQSQQLPTEEPEIAEEPTGSPSALVVCGPSGVGKGTLIELLLEESEGFAFCISHTTRKPRGRERDGIEYYFVDTKTFEKGIENRAFLEHAKVHDCYYGTSCAAVEKVLDSGACCILDIDVQVRKSGLRAVFVFIAPPSEDELERRLRDRGTDREEQIRTRLKAAREEMQSMREPGLFDFCIVNGDLSQAYRELRLIAMQARSGLLPEATANGAMSPSKSETGVRVTGMRTWKEKIALLTDAASPLGTELCIALSKAGMRLIAVGRNREDLEKLQGNLMGGGHSILAENFLPVVCDITKEGEVFSLRKIAKKRWPEAATVDVLINLASSVREGAGLLEGTTSAWVEMLSANVLGSLICSREVIKDMKEDGEERYIVNISVMDSQAPSESIPLFRAISQAMQSLSSDLREEIQGKESGVCVVSIWSDAPVESAEVSRAVLSVLASRIDVHQIRL